MRQILDARFADADDIGADTLLSQRLQNVFLSTSDDVFRQYAYHALAGFRSIVV